MLVPQNSSAVPCQNALECRIAEYVYAVFPRAYSKSFLSVMALMIRCILYPGAHLFVTSGGKEQGASILHDKV